MKNPTENQVERRRAIERERQYTSEERRALTSFIERVETLGKWTRPHLGTLDTEVCSTNEIGEISPALNRSTRRR